ncbi:hypothetical protein D3C80_1047680 [compost metagenome]
MQLSICFERISHVFSGKFFDSLIIPGNCFLIFSAVESCNSSLVIIARRGRITHILLTGYGKRIKVRIIDFLFFNQADRLSDRSTKIVHLLQLIIRFRQVIMRHIILRSQTNNLFKFLHRCVDISYRGINRSTGHNRFHIQRIDRQCLIDRSQSRFKIAVVSIYFSQFIINQQIFRINFLCFQQIVFRSEIVFFFQIIICPFKVINSIIRFN